MYKKNPKEKILKDLLFKLIYDCLYANLFVNKKAPSKGLLLELM